MIPGRFGRPPASAYATPERASRQWVLENSGLGDRIFVKTPDWAEVPIPEDRRDIAFTHAVYVVDCIHDFEDYCTCSDDNSVEWEFVEYFNINEVLNV